MRICEVFHSLQGEGVDIGLPTVFVRTVGCNLRCAWCDTKYARDGGADWGIDRLEKRILSYKCPRTCITGGEPLLQPDLGELAERLLSLGTELSLETNGSLPVAGLLKLDRKGQLRVSMDVKCPSSKMQGTTRLENLRELGSSDQVKFVLRDLKDYSHARKVLSAHPTKARVVFQPVWGQSGARLAERVLRDGLDVRVLVQLHKLFWGPKTKGR